MEMGELCRCARNPKFVKIALASNAGIRYTIRRFHHGDIAQLVERLNGIEKVRGSTPLISTIGEAALLPLFLSLLLKVSRPDDDMTVAL